MDGLLERACTRCTVSGAPDTQVSRKKGQSEAWLGLRVGREFGIFTRGVQYSPAHLDLV